MKIAILGAGLAGLSTAVFLLVRSKGMVSIDIFDPLPIGEGSSGVAAGLLHPYPGRRVEKAWEADLCLEKSHYLLTEVSETIRKSLILSKGILRIATTQEETERFKKRASEERNLEFYPKERCEEIQGIQLPKEGSGLFLKQGLRIDMPTYLDGLYQWLIRFGVNFYQRPFNFGAEPIRYDHFVLTMGYNIKQFVEFQDLPIKPMKGQILTIAWPKGVEPFPFPIVGEGFIALDQEQKTAVAGATFEREFKDLAPDQTKAQEEITRKIAPFFPAIREAKVLGCRAGLRAMPEGRRLPIIGCQGGKYWFITGLGAKGLLMHGYLGDLLAHALLHERLDSVPAPLLWNIP